MKKDKRKSTDDMRPEYNFASMKGGVRGKYAKRYRAGTNLILLDPELAEAFPTDAAVNRALRAVLKMTETVRLATRP
jgi:alpha-beta hydrolase superfamily lysophospholipase